MHSLFTLNAFPQNDLKMNEAYNQFVNHSYSRAGLCPWDTYLPDRPYVWVFGSIPVRYQPGTHRGCVYTQLAKLPSDVLLASSLWLFP